MQVSKVRARFPALRRLHAGEPVAYFDGPGGTQVPLEVAAAMTDYLLHHNANTHWAYPTSVETDQAIANARLALADFIGASPDEIAFGANMTTLAFHLSRALGRGWTNQDEIVVTELDHQANVAPWQALARERGVRLSVVRFDPRTGQLDWSSFEQAVGSRTRLVAVGAASNALGTISDVRRAIDLARSVGALTFVDAVHYAPHRLIDVADLGCDFLACSSYKFYGPHLGILYGRRELLQSLDVPKLDPAPDTVPERMETGTQNHEGIVGAAAAVDFLASLGDGPTRRARLLSAYSAIQAHEDRLLSRLWRRLSAVPGVTLYGVPPGGPRTATVSFTMAGIPSEGVARHLAARGVFVSNGDFYASTVAQRLGVERDGLVRVGCSCYSTEGEIDRLVEGVGQLGD